MLPEVEGFIREVARNYVFASHRTHDTYSQAVRDGYLRNDDLCFLGMVSGSRLAALGILEDLRQESSEPLPTEAEISYRLLAELCDCSPAEIAERHDHIAATIRTYADELQSGWSE